MPELLALLSLFTFKCTQSIAVSAISFVDLLSSFQRPARLLPSFPSAFEGRASYRSSTPVSSAVPPLSSTALRLRGRGV